MDAIKAIAGLDAQYLELLMAQNGVILQRAMIVNSKVAARYLKKKNWIDGYITGFDRKKNKWSRKGQIDVCLNGLDNSKDIKQEFLEEVKNQHKHGGESAIAIYGITKNPKDGNYMMVMEYAEQGSLRKLLDSYRPKIRCEVPQLFLDLMNKCLDAEPRNRPTAEELANTLNNFFRDLKNKRTELYKQTHPQAIYTSRFLNLSNLPKPAIKMDYNIRSNDHYANDVILTALEDLENMFFVESSDYEESNSISDNDDNEEVLDISDDINLDRLNEFEFVEASNNYIEDKIYNNLKLIWFLVCRVGFESLDKTMWDMVIKGQLMAFQKEDNTKKTSSDNRKYFHLNYYYNNDIQICYNTYLALAGVSHKYLENIKQHLQDHGLEEHIHSNTGRAPKNMNRIEVNYNVACEVFKFLKNYSDVYGLPSPE
ncbi:9643_t:CDS:2 [Cetraspora pellucida]|uniref:9643_t:CDS:1 n=1 Tax=Cetraspora pellucida TaxID=1433469 RepID=A0A9N8VMI8_9GLOM|nr:9643_t:CDS:2 [Cetraspora pellucida]